MDAMNHRCEDFRENIQRYLDGEMNSADREIMEAQAKACPDCARALDGMTELLTMCAELDEGREVPPAARAAWRGAIRAEARVRRKPTFGFFARSVAALAAAMVLLTVGTMSLRMRGALTPVGGDTAQYSQLNYGTEPSTGGGGAYVPEMAAKDTDGVRAYQTDGSVDQGGDVTGDVVGDKDDGVVVLRSASRSIETTHFDTDLGAVRDLVTEYGAYFEVLSQSGTAIQPGQSAGRSASMTVRVPTAQLDSFLTALDAIGQTVSQDQYAEDITSQYTDTQTRLATLKAQRDQLDTMMKSAVAIEDMIAITDKQRDVQTEIDSLEGQVKAWDSRVDYSSVSLNMTEVADGNRINTIGTTLGQRIAQGFHDSLNWMVGFAQDALVVLVMAGPQLVIAIPVLIVILFIARAVRNRRRRK